VDWNTKHFCCESVSQKLWQFCDRSAWISKRVLDSSQSCCSISQCHEDQGSKLRGYWFDIKEDRWKCKNSKYTLEYCGSERGYWKKTHCSARRHSVSLGGLSEARVRWILHKDLHFYPYKIQVTNALHEQQDCDKSWSLSEIHAERSQNCHHFCKTLSQVKHVVLRSAAPLQLKRFKVGSKIAMAASAPLLPNQNKNSVAKSPYSLTQHISVFNSEKQTTCFILTGKLKVLTLYNSFNGV
jgi:hypothetical protein